MVDEVGKQEERRSRKSFSRIDYRHKEVQVGRAEGRAEAD